jgi:phage-related protein
MTAYITLNNMPVALDTTVRRGVRSQRVQFGDGYSQILTDGLNAQQEVWECSTGPLTQDQTYGIESYLYRKKGQAFTWTPPDSTKAFTAQFESGILELGYSNLSALTLTGYTRPTDYTANLATGRLTSVTISNLVDVSVSLTLAARNYIIESGWQFEYISPVINRLSFTLRQVYV